MNNDSAQKRRSERAKSAVNNELSTVAQKWKLAVLCEGGNSRAKITSALCGPLLSAETKRSQNSAFSFSSFNWFPVGIVSNISSSSKSSDDAALGGVSITLALSVVNGIHAGANFIRTARVMKGVAKFATVEPHVAGTWRFHFSCSNESVAPLVIDIVVADKGPYSSSSTADANVATAADTSAADTCVADGSSSTNSKKRKADTSQLTESLEVAERKNGGAQKKRTSSADSNAPAALQSAAAAANRSSTYGAAAVVVPSTSINSKRQSDRVAKTAAATAAAVAKTGKSDIRKFFQTESLTKVDSAVNATAATTSTNITTSATDAAAVRTVSRRSSRVQQLQQQEEAAAAVDVEEVESGDVQPATAATAVDALEPLRTSPRGAVERNSNSIEITFSETPNHLTTSNSSSSGSEDSNEVIEAVNSILPFPLHVTLNARSRLDPPLFCPLQQQPQLLAPVKAVSVQGPRLKVLLPGALLLALVRDRESTTPRFIQYFALVTAASANTTTTAAAKTAGEKFAALKQQPAAPLPAQTQQPMVSELLQRIQARCITKAKTKGNHQSAEEGVLQLYYYFEYFFEDYLLYKEEQAQYASCLVRMRDRKAAYSHHFGAIYLLRLIVLLVTTLGATDKPDDDQQQQPQQQQSGGRSNVHSIVKPIESASTKTESDETTCQRTRRSGSFVSSAAVDKIDEKKTNNSRGSGDAADSSAGAVNLDGKELSQLQLVVNEALLLMDEQAHVLFL